MISPNDIYFDCFQVCVNMSTNLNSVNFTSVILHYELLNELAYYVEKLLESGFLIKKIEHEANEKIRLLQTYIYGCMCSIKTASLVENSELDGEVPHGNISHSFTENYTHSSNKERQVYSVYIILNDVIRSSYYLGDFYSKAGSCM